MLHHVSHLAGSRRNLIVLVGYQAHGTRARLLAEGAREIKIHGRQVPIRCKVLQVHGLSGHSDRDELLKWVGSAPRSPKLAFTVHGEPPSAEALAKHLEERFGIRTLIPELDQEFDVLAELAEAEARAAEAETLVMRAPPDLVEAAAEAAPETPPAPAGEPSAEEAPPAEVEDLAAAGRARRLLQSSSYRRADRDLDFLQRDEVRASRLQLEFLKPELALLDRGVDGTIVVFGGSRVISPRVAAARLAEARHAAEAEPGNEALAAEMAKAERRLRQSGYYEVARGLGRIVGRIDGPEGYRLLTVTGGGPGIMEAANRGAADVGAASIGLNITLPHEQAPSLYISPELCFQFRYFRPAQDALPDARPGGGVLPRRGYGTLDELFETLCLVQTRTIEPLPLVLVGRSHWQKLVDFDYLADEGLIGAHDTELFAMPILPRKPGATSPAGTRRRGRS